MVDLTRIDDGLLEDLQRALAAGATAVDAVTGVPLVLTYADVERLAHDHRLAGVGLTMFDAMAVPEGPLRDWYGALMFTTEGGEHARLRRLVSRAFTPRAVERLRHDAEELAGAAMDRVVADGGGDLVEAFGRVPIRIMCRLLGVPEEDVEVFGDWADSLSPIFGWMEPAQMDAASAAIVDLLGYIDALARTRRDSPADDLMTALLAESDGERLRFDEAVAMVANLIVGGHDTTASQLGCTLLTLVRHPDAVQELRSAAAPALSASAVTETIRIQPAIVAVPRTTTAMLELDGASLDAGSLVLLCTGAANRDAGVWKEPERFDVSRFTAPDAPRLLSFGAGVHYCLGAALARLTLEEAVAAYVGAGQGVVPAEDPWTLEWRSVLGRSPARLPVAVG